MKAPLVSVLTPAYGAEDFLAETIESVLGQSYTNIEYIIIEDCSPDGTWEIIEKYAKQDTRIKAFRNPQNLRIAGTRNRCVSLAAGTYVAWQDADDISLPERIARQVERMEAHPKVGICGTAYEMFNTSGPMRVRRFPQDDAALRKMIFKASPVSQPTAMIRKSCLDEAGEYDGTYRNCEDLDMTFRIGRQHELANVDEVLVRYRVHDASTTFKDMNVMLKDTLAIRKKYNDGIEYRKSAGDHVACLATRAMSMLPAAWTVGLFDKLRPIFVKAESSRSGT